MPANTPFFQAFGSLLFGRRPRKLLEKVGRVDSLGELYELFGEMLPDRLLARSEKGTNSRERVLTPKVTFWAFVSQVLDVGSSCREVVRKVEAWWRWSQKDLEAKPALSPSAYCQARARLDMQSLRLIHGHLAWSLERRVTSQEKWLGRRVKIVDGSTLSMPDTPANQESWPQPSSQKAGLGFPCMKLVGLFSLASGALEDYATGTLHEHESMLFRSLWEKLAKGDVLLGDRGFCSYAALARLAQRGMDSVMRLHQARKVNFREGRRLGKDDRLVTWKKPVQRTEAWSLEEWAALPETLSLRLIRLFVSTPGFRTRQVTLVTTLTDAQSYPAEEIRALYAQRWGVELHFAPDQDPARLGHSAVQESGANRKGNALASDRLQSHPAADAEGCGRASGRIGPDQLQRYAGHRAALCGGHSRGARDAAQTGCLDRANVSDHRARPRAQTPGAQ